MTIISVVKQDKLLGTLGQTLLEKSKNLKWRAEGGEEIMLLMVASTFFMHAVQLD